MALDGVPKRCRLVPSLESAPLFLWSDGIDFTIHEKSIMKILLVEDSKFLKMATERALTTAGDEVISASDGDQALSMAREHLPTLILLDIMLPKMSGPDVLKALKEVPATAQIPVIMLTSLSQKNAAQLERDGASGFFEKSDSMLGRGPDSLVAAVDRMLKSKTGARLI
jgi:CheY-like chemotaxis protein